MARRRSARSGLVLVVVAMVVGFAGCSDSGSSKAKSPPSSDAGGSDTSPERAQPLASATGDIAATRVDLYALERTGDALRLEFGVTGTGSSDRSQPLISLLQDPGIANPFVHNASGVTLLDAEHSKEYRVLLGPEEKSCRCSEDLAYVDSGETVRLFAEFPLPPKDVTSLQVVVPHFTPMLGVKIASAEPAPGARLPAAPAAMAEGQGDTSGLALEVYDVRRVANLAFLRFALRNAGTKSFLTVDRFEAQELKKPIRFQDFSGVTLLDPVAQLKYASLADSSGYCLCSGATNQDGPLEPGTTDVLWAGFPAPPAGVKSVEVQVPLFPAVTVPVTDL